MLLCSLFIHACARSPQAENVPRFEDAFSNLPASASTLDNGVVYVEVTTGAGAAPAPLRDVTIDYSVWLADGTPVDSSGRRAPMTFTYGTSQMIRGFEDGIRGMREGGRRRFLVPAALAYPRDGAPGVPAKSALLFDVRLLKVTASSDIGTDGSAQ